VEKILLVDDEQSLLDGFHRQLHKKFNIETANGGHEGMKKIAESGPFAVIISDMRMPVMDGVTFLMEVRKAAPASVRMMLTGNADQQTAIDAINRGSIFRFLAKPCSPENLSGAIDAGIEQYRLITAEKELLQETLKGSIKILTDILSLAYPIAFSQSMRIRKYAAQIAQKLKLFGGWQYEIAAMLSSVGLINMPAESIKKYMAGEPLSKEEKEMVDAIPQITGMLLANIPRLSNVASMITQRDMPYTKPLDLTSSENNEMIRIGAKILKVITDFDILLLQNHAPEDAIKIMARQGKLYDSTILDALTKIDPPSMVRVYRSVKINELRKGMIIDTNIFNARGFLIMPKGFEVNDMTAERLKNFLNDQGRLDTIRVVMSAYKE
jgi:response regulator RpfG family c-di-GMP phosphodiesterase